jgi:hypothetical protein
MDIIWLLFALVIVVLSYYYYTKANLNNTREAPTEPIPEETENTTPMSAPNSNEEKDIPITGPSVEGIRFLHIAMQIL